MNPTNSIFRGFARYALRLGAALLTGALASSGCFADTPAAATPAPAPVAPAPTTTPAPAATPAPTDHSPVASVPIRYVGDKVVVDALIDGHGPFALGIDSGSETMLVTQKVAEACKLAQQTGTVVVAGTTGGYNPVPQAMVEKLEIGGASVEKPFCTVTSSNLPVDGYIGAPLLNAYTAQIDPDTLTLRLYRPDSYQPDPHDAPIPIPFGKLRVPITSGTLGGIPASLEIDTGSAFPAELVPRFVAAHDLARKFPKIGTAGLVSAHGPTASDVYALTGLTLGQGGLAGINGAIPTLFLDPTLPAPGDYDGRIGAPLLRHFVLTFDYAHATLYVRPAAQPAAPPTPAQTAAPTP